MYDWAEFRHFRYLLAILERRGFRAAAEDLHTSQPNLTVQARQFQENAGVCLFQKLKTGRIRPTDSGVAFIGLARHLLEVRDEVLEAVVAIERGEITSLSCASSSLVDPELFRELCSLQRRLLPTISIRPTYGDIHHLIEELEIGTVDIALVTLPLVHPHLHIEEIRRNRLVACLRKDDPLAQKPALALNDLQERLRVFYHPQKHPEAHERLLELLHAAGIGITDYSRASHPSDLQTLVRGGFGVALVREGLELDNQLTTLPILGIDWTVDTALVYHKLRHPKTIPILVRQFKKQFGSGISAYPKELTPLHTAIRKSAKGLLEDPEKVVQLRLLG